MVAAERIFDILETEAQISTLGNIRLSVQGNLKDLRFSYLPGEEIPAVYPLPYNLLKPLP